MLTIAILNQVTGYPCTYMACPQVTEIIVITHFNHLTGYPCKPLA